MISSFSGRPEGAPVRRFTPLDTCPFGATAKRGNNGVIRRPVDLAAGDSPWVAFEYQGTGLAKK